MSCLINKIAIGTAQFGLNYGINNIRGRIPPEEVFTILDFAVRKGVDTVDTAYSYGNSEAVIGEYIRNSSCGLRIITKLPECELDNVKKIFRCSLKNLEVDKVYGYMVHSFASFKEKPEIYSVLQELKNEGKVEKIGFSLYYPEELEYLFRKNINFDLLQVPFNIFDQRFSGYFSQLKRAGVEIHVRSVFLQGLIFKKADCLSPYFLKIKKHIESLHSLSERNSLGLVALALNFPLANEFVDRVIVGVDSITHLKEIVSSVRFFSEVVDLLPELKKFRINDEDILVPSNWKLD